MSPGPGPRKWEPNSRSEGIPPALPWVSSFFLSHDGQGNAGRQSGSVTCSAGPTNPRLSFFVPIRKQLSTPSLLPSMLHCLWNSGSPWSSLYNPAQTFSTQCFFLKGSKASFLPDISKLNRTRELPSILPLGYLCDPGQVSTPPAGLWVCPSGEQQKQDCLVQSCPPHHISGFSKYNGWF